MVTTEKCFRGLRGKLISVTTSEIIQDGQWSFRTISCWFVAKSPPSIETNVRPGKYISSAVHSACIIFLVTDSALSPSKIYGPHLGKY